MERRGPDGVTILLEGLSGAVRAVAGSARSHKELLTGQIRPRGLWRRPGTLGRIRRLDVLDEAIDLRLGEGRPARHHRVHLTTAPVLTFGDRQRDLFGYAAPAAICRIQYIQISPVKGGTLMVCPATSNVLPAWPCPWHAAQANL